MVTLAIHRSRTGKLQVLDVDCNGKSEGFHGQAVVDEFDSVREAEEFVHQIWEEEEAHANQNQH